MSFHCANRDKLGEHQHSVREEAYRCYGLPGYAPVVPIAPVTLERKATEKQLAYIKDLGGDLDYARLMTVPEASQYIDELKKEGKAVTTPAVPTTDPNLAMIEAMSSLIDKGYYAVEDGPSLRFLFVSRPKSGRYAGTVKIQTQHGDNYQLALVRYPNGQWRTYQRGATDLVMILLSDKSGAMLRYAQEIGRCCRCNASLTDPRSRHYGIGPECEKAMGWLIETVNLSERGAYVPV